MDPYIIQDSAKHPSYTSGAGGITLDLDRLEDARENRRGDIIARCPACAASGGDRNCNHLIIYQDGKFGCVACPGDHEHRQEIFRLVGKKGGKGKKKRQVIPPPRPIPIKVIPGWPPEHWPGRK